MEELTAETFLEILKGKHHNKDSEYCTYYRKIPHPFSNESEIYINNVKVSGELEMKNTLAVSYRVTIENSTFLSDIILYNIIFKNSFTISSSIFNGELNFIGKKFNSIYINKSEFKKSISFTGGFFCPFCKC